jgi:hypothetical protein
MAIEAIGPRYQDRKGTTNEDGTRTLVRAWNVTTTSDADGEPQVIDGVIAADASAELYAAHPNWAWATCRGHEATPNGGPRVWIVKATYSTSQFKASGDGSGEGSNGAAPNPAQSMDAQADARPPNIKVARKEVTKVLEKDADTGDRVVNTVGDPFDPLPEVFRSHHVITWTFCRKPSALNWSARAAFMDSVNLAAFVILGKTYPARTLRCTAYDVGSVWDKGEAGQEFFFELTVTAEYDPDTWDVKILNRGRRRWIAGSEGDPANPPRYEYIRDHTGQVVQEPVPLTEAGDVVPAVEPGEDPAYHYVEPKGYVPRSWATILA